MGLKPKQLKQQAVFGDLDFVHSLHDRQYSKDTCNLSGWGIAAHKMVSSYPRFFLSRRNIKPVHGLLRNTEQARSPPGGYRLVYGMYVTINRVYIPPIKRRAISFVFTRYVP